MKLETTEKRVKQHTVYKVDGKRVPGVTTILGVLNKPALVKWANNLGLQGIDSTKYVNVLANIGTLAHDMAACDFLGIEPDLSDYSPSDVDKAENALLSFWAWRDQHEVEPILVEEPLVSATYRFGGQIDCYAKVDGKLTLIDLKTGKGIYSEMIHQLAAYKQLLTENGHALANVRILRIGRDEGEGFEDRVVDLSSLEPHWRIFALCREMYDLQKITRGQ